MTNYFLINYFIFFCGKLPIKKIYLQPVLIEFNDLNNYKIILLIIKVFKILCYANNTDKKRSKKRRRQKSGFVPNGQFY